MTSGARIALIVAAVVLAVLAVGVLLVMGGAYWWYRSADQQSEAMQAADLAEQAEAARAELKAAPADAGAGRQETRALPLPERRDRAIRRAVAYLVGEQAPDGSWGDGNVGITALCTNALLAGGKTIEDPAIKKAISRPTAASTTSASGPTPPASP